MVNAVADIHIKPPWLSKERLVAGGAAAIAVAGRLILGIRLRFNNHAPQQTSIRLAFHQPAAHQIGGNNLRWAAEESVGWAMGGVVILRKPRRKKMQIPIQSKSENNLNRKTLFSRLLFTVLTATAISGCQMPSGILNNSRGGSIVFTSNNNLVTKGYKENNEYGCSREFKFKPTFGLSPTFSGLASFTNTRVQYGNFTTEEDFLFTIKDGQPIEYWEVYLYADDTSNKSEKDGICSIKSAQDYKIDFSSATIQAFPSAKVTIKPS